MRNYKLINNVIGWAVFAIAAFVYCSTIEPTASFWDCGEYIACANKLEVGHPPGAPFFLLIGRFFSLFASDAAHVAMMVNIMSALCSAGTILFLFWSITRLARKFVKDEEMSMGASVAVLGSGIVGALAYTFCDSFWFSAVEGEVYAMSSFFTAIVFWAILRWEEDADEPTSDRWLVFIAYMMGLSIGVHLLNLLTIPAIVFIYYFRRFKPDPAKQVRGIIITGLVSVLLLGVIQNGIIPGVVSGSASYELFFVNKLGLPFNVGTILYFVLLIAFIVFGLIYSNKGGDKAYRNLLIAGGVFFGLVMLSSLPVTVDTSAPVKTFDGGAFVMRLLTFGGAAGVIYLLRNNRRLLNTIFLSFAVLLIGYSSFLVLVIRSQANTPMDENNPENAINLLAYLNREQYGDWPILYGPYFNSSVDGYLDGTPVYQEDPKTGTYIVSDERLQTIPSYNPEMCTIFPRMWEGNQSNHEAEYRKWSGMDDDPESVNTVSVTERNGQTHDVAMPTFGNNLKYFFDYQLGWMYKRYFMWNFVGRQNDVQGNGNLTDGNWESGFSALSQSHVESYPYNMAHNKGENHFYYIPLLLGLFGLIFQFWRDWRNGLVVMLMFLLTGVAIVIYLNQYPLQPRERDYAYAGSFYAFAFWIGFAVYGLYHFIKRYVTAPMVAAGLPIVACMSAPILMAKDGWDDHDRSDRYTCRDFAKNYLASCAPNAILFTNGDNDTFPLWYVQEVESYRTDVRVVNLSLLNTDWYIDQMRRKAYDSDPVPFTLSTWETRQGTRDQVFMFDYVGRDPWKGYHSVQEIMKFIQSNKDSTKIVDSRQNSKEEGYLDTLSYLPTNKLYVPVDKKLVRDLGVVDKNTPDSLIADSLKWELDTKKRKYIFKADLMILDILAANNWKRPVYFAVTAGGDAYLDLDEWFQLEGLAYRLVPIKQQPYRSKFGRASGVNTAIMYKHVMQDFSWGGIDKNEVYLDENNLRMTANLRIQMMTLAEALIDEGKKDSAEKVIDKCLAVMPERNVPYERSMVYFVEDYYTLGKNQKAIALSNRLFKICEEELRYYNLLAADNDKDMSSGESEMSRRVLDMLRSDANKYGEKAAFTDYDNRYKKLIAEGAIKVQQQPQQQMPQFFDPNKMNPGGGFSGPNPVGGPVNAPHVKPAGGPKPAGGGSAPAPTGTTPPPAGATGPTGGK